MRNRYTNSERFILNTLESFTRNVDAHEKRTGIHFFSTAVRWPLCSYPVGKMMREDSLNALLNLDIVSKLTRIVIPRNTAKASHYMTQRVNQTRVSCAIYLPVQVFSRHPQIRPQPKLPDSIEKNKKTRRNGLIAQTMTAKYLRKMHVVGWLPSRDSGTSPHSLFCQCPSLGFKKSL